MTAQLRYGNRSRSVCTPFNSFVTCTPRPPQTFNALDLNGDGVLSSEEFFVGLKKRGLRFSKSEMRKLLDAVDANKSGKINYVEFLQAFRVADSGSVRAGNGVRCWCVTHRN